MEALSAGNATRYHREWNLESLPVTNRNGLLVHWAGHNREILEFGCATGFLARYFVQNGCSVTGVEADPVAAEQAEQFCQKVYVCDIESSWPFAGKYDCIIFGDVLEHLRQPERALIRCRDYLARDGEVLVSLPNVAFWKSRLQLLLGNWDYTETGLMDRTHLKFFAIRSAKRLFLQSGFKVIDFDIASTIRGSERFSVIHRLTSVLPTLLGFQMMFKLRPI